MNFSINKVVSIAWRVSDVINNVTGQWNEKLTTVRPQLLKRDIPEEEGNDGTDSHIQEKGALATHLVKTSTDRRRSSTNDAEFTKSWEYQLKELIFDPDGGLYYYWMGLVAMATMYNCGILILRIAFSELREVSSYQTVFSFFDYLSDVIYLVDIVVQMRTGYLEDGIMMLDPEKLKHNYKRKSEFKMDLLSLAPIGTVVFIFAKFSTLVDVVGLENSHMFTPIIRIHRLLKYHMVPKFFEVTDSQTNNPNAVRAFKLSLYLWVVIHWIGCFYYMLSEYEGLGTNPWVYPNTTDSQRFLSSKYIRSLYWSTVTLTTIGGTESPDTSIEYVFTGVTFLIGVFVFAAVVGNVGDVISNMNAARQDYLARMDQIKFYMNHRSIPPFLQNRVKRWADYSWTRTQAIDESSLLQMLPERIRTEIAIHTNLDTLKKVQIFEECEEGLLQELVLKLRSQIYSPRDYICRIGEIGREMFIINHGKVEILVHNPTTGGKMIVATLTSGNYFGEISLLKLDAGQNRRTADVRSVGYSELFCLSRKDLMSALVEYPDAKVILEEKAKERMQMNKQARRSKNAASEEETNINTVVAPAVTSGESMFKKKSRLADVIRSDIFQKLVSTRGQEMTELKHVINELKSFDSQATKYRIQQLSDKCEGLMNQLKTRDTELQRAIKRIAELEQTILHPKRKSTKRSFKNGLKLPATGNTCKHCLKRYLSVDEQRRAVSDGESESLALRRQYDNDKRSGNNQNGDDNDTPNGSKETSGSQTAEELPNRTNRVNGTPAGTTIEVNGNGQIRRVMPVPRIRVNDVLTYEPSNHAEPSPPNSPESSISGQDFDFNMALLAVMAIGQQGQISDISNSNSGNSSNSSDSSNSNDDSEENDT